MMRRYPAFAVPLIAALALGACSQDNTGDRPPAGASSLANATFLLFPNPQVQADGSLQTDTVGYAQAYYAAIDPMNAKDTLAKWKAANLFDSGTGTQLEVVFGDVRDLGYGRRMTVRQNLDGTVAAYVENYMVGTLVNYAFSGLNVEAAVQRVPRWHVSTNAIEFSPGPGGGASFLKFFQFDAAAGTRNLTVNLDGRGEKAMPGVCLTCHGGRGDPLTPPGAGGQPLFPRVMNSVTQHRGDAQARMQPLAVDSFAFSTTAGFTRADQEAALKAINMMVLCTYPRAGAAAGTEDNCRLPTSAVYEWQGTAAALIKAAYGGNGLPNAMYSDTFVPPDWTGQAALYQGVVAPVCRTCHLLRGTNQQSDIDFNAFASSFTANPQGYADRMKIHIFDRGNMPLAKIVFDDFFSTGKADILATVLEGQGQVVRDGAGAILRPGRPVADPGPGRTLRQGATTLSAAGSRFSTTYSWSIVSGPGGTLTNPGSAQPTFTATADGTYVLQLVTGNGTAQSAPAQLTLVVNNALTPAPSAIRFAHIKAVLQDAVSAQCTACHVPGGGPPIFYTDVDRNDDAAVTPIDELWFYTEVRGRINFSDVVASPLLRKPSGNHHGGDQRPGFDLNPANPPGHADRASYDLFLNWILNGAPYQ